MLHRRPGASGKECHDARGFDESSAEERNHRHRDGVRGKQRKDHRQRQRGEQKLAHAVKERYREKDHDGGERGGQHGQRDFAAALFGGHFGRFAEFQMAVDVFQHDDGVIDQAREGQRQSAQHHAVDGAAAERKRDECGQRGKRNREEHRDRGAHAAEEDQDHHRGQQQADAAFVQQRLDGGLDEHRLIEHDVGDQAASGTSTSCLSAALTPSTTAMVLVSPPCFSTGT